MKKIMLLTTLVVALVLPGAAIANEPAEWYVGDQTGQEYKETTGWWGGEIVHGTGTFHITNPTFNYYFTCGSVVGTLWADGDFETISECNPEYSSPECPDFKTWISTDNATPSLENGVPVVDAEGRTMLEFIAHPTGGNSYICSGYPGAPEVVSKAPLHGTWDNETQTLKFKNAWLGNETTMTGEFTVEGFEGPYMLLEEEVEEFFYGSTPLSIR